MFNIGITEIIVIVIAILIFIKPRELPGFLRQIGKLLGQLRNFSRTVNRQIHQAEYSLRLQEPRDKEEADPAESAEKKADQNSDIHDAIEK